MNTLDIVMVVLIAGIIIVIFSITNNNRSKMEELIDLFDECENERHQNEIETNQEFFEPTKNENHFRILHKKFLEKLKKHKFGGTTESGENLDAIKKCNLNIDEASAIYLYTSHHIFTFVNYQLRYMKSPDADATLYSNILDSALNKLDSYNDETVFRDIRNPVPDVNNCLSFYMSKVGEKILFKEFLSCHTDDIRISDLKDDFQFVIRTNSNSNGKDLQEITFLALEREILFKKNTTFKIDHVDLSVNRVFMSEV